MLTVVAVTRYMGLGGIKGVVMRLQCVKPTTLMMSATEAILLAAMANVMGVVESSVLLDVSGVPSWRPSSPC